MEFTQTAKNIDLRRFFKKWNVAAGRVTAFEKYAKNPTESYKWDSKRKRIDVDYSFDFLSNKRGHLPQKAYVIDRQTNAHWKVKFFGIFAADYLILAVDPDYKWAAVGVPSQRYLWILSDETDLSQNEINGILTEVKTLGYRTDHVLPSKH